MKISFSPKLIQRFNVNLKNILTGLFLFVFNVEPEQMNLNYIWKYKGQKAENGQNNLEEEQSKKLTLDIL